MSRKYVKIDEHGKEILELKREGKTNREIAQMLGVDKERKEWYHAALLAAASLCF